MVGAAMAVLGFILLVIISGVVRARRDRPRRDAFDAVAAGAAASIERRIAELPLHQQEWARRQVGR